MAKRFDKSNEHQSDETTAEDSVIDLISEVIFEQFLRNARLKTKLKNNPDGFHLSESAFPCRVCNTPASGKDSWYDSYGLKCMRCQTAINQGELPPFVATKKDTYYTETELKEYFGLFGNILKEFLKMDLLHARILKAHRHYSEFYLFFVRENREFLPPKKLVKEKKQTVIVNGNHLNVMVPWYETRNSYSRLKNYGINKYLEFTNGDEVER